LYSIPRIVRESEHSNEISDSFAAKEDIEDIRRVSENEEDKRVSGNNLRAAKFLDGARALYWVSGNNLRAAKFLGAREKTYWDKQRTGFSNISLHIIYNGV